MARITVSVAADRVFVGGVAAGIVGLKVNARREFTFTPPAGAASALAAAGLMADGRVSIPVYRNADSLTAELADGSAETLAAARTGNAAARRLIKAAAGVAAATGADARFKAALLKARAGK